MSGTDYTQTTNYGLYKPISNADINQWGSHLNANADTIDGVMHGFLPLAGGTPTGPIMITATGGSVARSAQARAADAANVLDYGADPTGAADSSVAFNAAAGQVAPGGAHKSVHVPAGTYRINNQITLTGSQTLFGDGRGNTFLTVDQNFNASASSVILCGPSADWGVSVRDLTISFAQPSDVTSRATFKTLATGGTSTTGGTGVQYPWAIWGLNGAGRIKVQNVQVRGAWNGFLFDTVCWIDNIEMGAAGTGFAQSINASVMDWCFIGTYEHWAYGWNTTGQLAIFTDGQTIAIQCGVGASSQSGIMAQSIANLGGRLIFHGAGWSTITNLNNDSDWCSIEVYGHLWLEITNFYYTGGATAIRPAIQAIGTDTATRVFIHNMYAHTSSNYPLVTVSGNSELHILGCFIVYYPLAYSAFTVGPGLLRITNGRIVDGSSGTRTVPLIDHASGNLMIGDGVEIDSASGNVAVRFQQDYGGNYLGNIILTPGAIVTFPATVTYGQYGPLGLRASASYASDAAAATGGVALGRYYRNGSAVMVRVA